MKCKNETVVSSKALIQGDISSTMNYISKERRFQNSIKRELKRWMTLNEAIEEIKRALHCDTDLAVQQLRDAIGDGVIIVRWKEIGPEFDEFGPMDAWHRDEDNPTFSWEGEWKPPSDPTFWKNAEICLEGDGSVLDDNTNYQKLVWRDKDALNRIERNENEHSTGHAPISDSEFLKRLKFEAKKIQRRRVEMEEVVFRDLLILRDSVRDLYIRHDPKPLLNATDDEIRTCLTEVHNEASKRGEYLPNVNVTYALIQKMLRKQNKKTKKEHFRGLFKKEFSAFCRKRGQRR